ncbi:MAG: sugar ABC transporter substrate-binding protein [Verrucomicrobia bacterium]|nr:sugar ABC transporter substrate-binding protein [Verrucomicrobiota bacterium]
MNRIAPSPPHVGAHGLPRVRPESKAPGLPSLARHAGWGFLGLVLLLGLVTAGCNRAGAPASAKNHRTRVALVMKTLNSPFFLDMKRGAEEAARELGVELVAQAPEREVDVEKQMQIVENLIQTRVDALCLTPSGSKELVPVVGKANRAGIPVLIVDTRLDEATVQADGVRYVSFIGSDNYEGGRLAGQHVARLFPQPAQIAILEGIPGHETHDSRIRGFRDGLAGSPHLRIVASQPANAERDQGFNVMQNLLQAHRDIAAVFASNDLMALGALEAVAAAGRAGTIKILGFDATDEAREAIAAGRLEASVAQNPTAMGRLAVTKAVEALQGGTLPNAIPVSIELITQPRGQ